MHIVTFKAHAKINWSLSVTGKRDDGYHELDMLLQSVTMHDFITVSIQRSKGIDLLCSRPLGDIENNLAFKAANAFFQHTEILPDCRIYLHKYIPVCAGMGGGSADGDQTGPHPGCTVCAVSGSRLCVFLWNGDYHTGISEEDAGKDVQSYAGFADQVF